MRKLLLIIFSGVSIFTAGCESCRRKLKILNEKCTLTKESGEAEPLEKAVILLDMTASMRGFPNAGIMGTPWELIASQTQGMKRILTNMGVENIKYFVFLDPTEPPKGVKDGDFFAMVKSPGKFVGSGNDYSNILRWIHKNWDGRSLYIIITDLFQSNNDLFNLSREVERLVKDKEVSIGIVGIKSPFSGRVYDVEFIGNYDYVGPRYLYFFILGREPWIDEFVQSLKGSIDGESKVLVFTPRPAAAFRLEGKGIRGECPAVVKLRKRYKDTIKVVITPSVKPEYLYLDYRSIWQVRLEANNKCEEIDGGSKYGATFKAAEGIPRDLLKTWKRDLGSFCFKAMLIPDRRVIRRHQIPQWVNALTMDIERLRRGDEKQKGRTYGFKALMEHLYNIYSKSIKEEVLYGCVR